MVEESADRRSPVESRQGIAALIRRLLRPAAAAMLAAEGYQVENLSGGVLAWARERLPVQTGKCQG